MMDVPLPRVDMWIFNLGDITMPNCISFIRKSDKGHPTLHTIDEEICKHFNATVDAEKWYCHWYDIIARNYAMGMSKSDQLERFNGNMKNYESDPKMIEAYKRIIEILEFIDATYDISTWIEIGRRD